MQAWIPPSGVALVRVPLTPERLTRTVAALGGLHGVDPDMVVDNLPHATFKGEDAQLKAAITYLQKQIQEIESSLRGILRGFGLKVGEATPVRFEGRVEELVGRDSNVTSYIVRNVVKSV